MPDFIDGSLYKSAQKKLWDPILSELHVIQELNRDQTKTPKAVTHPTPDCGSDDDNTPDIDQLVREAEQLLAMDMPKLNVIDEKCEKVISETSRLCKECPPAEMEELMLKSKSLLEAHPPTCRASQDDKSIVETVRLLDDAQKVMRGVEIATITLPRQIHDFNMKLPPA
ncbi:Hypothetical protein NTJ_09399 [Nesidiocoris tenuis]|uniref:Uncharacterized protein n=1 Tax=Nesidiocoris tenuis TaxID=355587 RepID=A0ABN7AYW9_9HEMI|nr:Hypothetical protein NTJ_09399 [Nesidiocoris tenuis]